MIKRSPLTGIIKNVHNNNRYNHVFIAFVFAFTIAMSSGCYKEMVIPPEDFQTIDIIMTEEQRLHVWEARGVKFDLDDPKPQLTINNTVYNVKKIGLRGQSALNFSRKSFRVNLYETLEITNGDAIKTLHGFDLIAMASDYTYIENRCSHGILRQAGLFPLFRKFVEVKINGRTQGLYLLLEDPKSYALDVAGSEFILRRGYNHGIDNYEYQPNSTSDNVDYYLDKFNKIYSCIVNYDSVQLYDTLAGLFDISMYMKKLAVDYLLANGDYTDEIYFYSAPGSNHKFKIIPWDYDDVFSLIPHEIGSGWGTGTLFGTRDYPALQDQLNEKGNKPLYSIEDDLDFKIARDSFLYNKYLEEVENVLNSADDAFINDLFIEIENELMPYYNHNEIIAMSQYDDKPANMELFRENLQEKRSYLLERRSQMLHYINK